MMPWSALMEDACRFFERHLTDEHRRHLWTRYGLMPDFVEVMRIGYAPADGSALLLHLMDRGYSRDEIIGPGWWCPGSGPTRTAAPGPAYRISSEAGSCFRTSMPTSGRSTSSGG